MTVQVVDGNVLTSEADLRGVDEVRTVESRGEEESCADVCAGVTLAEAD